MNGSDPEHTHRGGLCTSQIHLTVVTPTGRFHRIPGRLCWHSFLKRRDLRLLGTLLHVKLHLLESEVNHTISHNQHTVKWSCYNIETVCEGHFHVVMWYWYFLFPCMAVTHLLTYSPSLCQTSWSSVGWVWAPACGLPAHQRLSRGNPKKTK